MEGGGEGREYPCPLQGQLGVRARGDGGAYWARGSQFCTLEEEEEEEVRAIPLGLRYPMGWGGWDLAHLGTSYISTYGSRPQQDWKRYGRSRYLHLALDPVWVPARRTL